MRSVANAVSFLGTSRDPAAMKQFLAKVRARFGYL